VGEKAKLCSKLVACSLSLALYEFIAVSLAKIDIGAIKANQNLISFAIIFLLIFTFVKNLISIIMRFYEFKTIKPLTPQQARINALKQQKALQAIQQNNQTLAKLKAA
jgi:predicted membrane protein